jgi:S1-C subfamily serine protease
VNDKKPGSDTGPTLDLNDQIADVVARVRAGMVKISNGYRSGGAGCIIHSEGLVVTNAHVIQSDKVRIHIGPDDYLEGRLLARDTRIDIAAIVVDANNLPVIPMGDSGGTRPGELVFSLGFPWGIEGGLTYGILIHLGPWPIENPRSREDFLTASLHLRPGHSGGPMFNSRGEIIGLNTIMQGPDVGVAVPINRAKRFLRDAISQMG